MARFDVYRGARPGLPYIVDVQANILSDLKTRVVIPLIDHAAAQTQAFPRLKPIVTVMGAPYVLITTDMAVVDIRRFGKPVANLESERDVIVDSIDFLLQGY